jgi:GNAT superfamily N-acetyltransferase
VSDIVRDLSPALLVAALEENLFSCIPFFGTLGASRCDDPPGVRRSITDLPLALCNNVMDARLSPSEADRAIERVLQDAQGRNVPILWWTSPASRPSDLERRLEAHGFVLEEETPGMALELRRLNEELPAPPGLRVVPAQEASAWQAWGRTWTEGFGIRGSHVDLWVDTWQKLFAHADPDIVRPYVGWHVDRAVATSLLLLTGGVAGVHAVATIPEARGRGIGAHMVLGPLRSARHMGYSAAVLQASAMGLRMYRSLGFRECCTVRSYVWAPASASVPCP